jgi:hypothetical protein
MIGPSVHLAGSRRPRKLAAGLLLALACAASGLLAGGCGAGNAIDPVAQAATTSASTPGYEMTLSMRLTSPALPAALTASGSGSFDVRDHSGSFTLAVDLGNQPQVVQALGSSTLQVEEIINGLTIYVKLPPAITSKLPGGTPWLKLDLAKAAAAAGVPGLSSFAGNPASSDPSQMLQYLRAVSGDVSNQGTEQINGVATNHYHATISLDRVADTLPASARSAARQSITGLENVTHTKELPVDAWIDGAHLVRRIQMSFNTSVQGQTLDAVTTIDIPEYGPQPAPALPPADKVTDASSLLGSTG